MVSLTSDHLSLYSIPALWVLAHYPSFKKAYIMGSRGSWNNMVPRSNIPRITEKRNIPPELATRLLQMDGAHQNGLENMWFFGLAVLAGNYAGLSNETLNKVSGLFILWRLAYTYVYLNQKSVAVAGLRSIIWGTSLVFPFYLLIKAAQTIGEKSN